MYLIPHSLNYLQKNRFAICLFLINEFGISLIIDTFIVRLCYFFIDFATFYGNVADMSASVVVLICLNCLCDCLFAKHVVGRFRRKCLCLVT